MGSRPEAACDGSFFFISRGTCPWDEAEERQPRPQPDGVEFAAWAWTDIDELIQQVALFRRPSYEEMLRGRR